ncbi:MAG: hypothetical protein QXY26_08380 [Ignisphaera sp.]
MDTAEMINELIIEHVEKVILSQWREIVILKNGKRIIIEPDIYPEITTCRGEWDCYMENIKLSIYEESGDEDSFSKDT